MKIFTIIELDTGEVYSVQTFADEQKASEVFDALLEKSNLSNECVKYRTFPKSLEKVAIGHDHYAIELHQTDI